jgi:hypothetical protein
MERVILLVVALVCALAPSLAIGWHWVSTLAPIVVGAVGFIFSWKAAGRATREEARAVRAERRAEEAERRAADAERRATEAHAWDRERREAEQARVRVQRRVEQWVSEKKASHGTAFFPVDQELDLARAASAMGLLDLKELPGADGEVVAAMARIIGAVIGPE